MLKDLVISAYNFAKTRHAGQRRAFVGIPYFTHPKGVARIVEKLTNVEALVAAAVLHDVLEDTSTTVEELVSKFGIEVALYVQELTSDPVLQKDLGKAQYLGHKMLCMSSGALTVKLADRLHNIMFLHLDVVPDRFVRKYNNETRHILSVLSARCLNTHQRRLVVLISDTLDRLPHRREKR